MPRLALERIDGEPAVASPLLGLLTELGFQPGPRRLTLAPDALGATAFRSKDGFAVAPGASNLRNVPDESNQPEARSALPPPAARAEHARARTGGPQPARADPRRDGGGGRAPRLCPHDRCRRDRSRRRVEARLLRAVLRQGGLLPFDLRRARPRAFAGSRSRHGSTSAAGRTACTPRVRRCSATLPARPRERALLLVEAFGAGAPRPPAHAARGRTPTSGSCCRCSASRPSARTPRRSPRGRCRAASAISHSSACARAASVSSSCSPSSSSTGSRPVAPRSGRRQRRPAHAAARHGRASCAPRRPRSWPAPTRARARSPRPRGSARERGLPSVSEERIAAHAGISGTSSCACSRAATLPLGAARRASPRVARDRPRGARARRRRGPRLCIARVRALLAHV